MIPFFTLLSREISRFLKVFIQTVITPLISSCLYLLVFGVSLGSKVVVDGDTPYLAFLIPGLVTMSLLNNSFQNTSSSLVSAKYTGEIEDLRVVPLSPHQIVWAMALAAVIRGEVVGLVTYMVGSVFYYVVHGKVLGMHSLPEYLFFTLSGGLSFGMLGLVAGFFSKSFDRLSAMTAFILLPLIYLGGVFVSLESLHPWWQEVAKFNPVIYFIDGVRHSILGFSAIPIERSMGVSLIGIVFLYGIALLGLKRGHFHRG